MTGTRRNEMQFQRWEWIDWDRGLVRIYTSKKQRGEQWGKNLAKTLRTVLLWPQLREILRDAWMPRGQPATGLLWQHLRRPTRQRLHAPAVEWGALRRNRSTTCCGLRGFDHGRARHQGIAAIPRSRGLPGKLAGVPHHLLRRSGCKRWDPWRASKGSGRRRSPHSLQPLPGRATTDTQGPCHAGLSLPS